jgi:hypothetical protein
MAPRTTTKKGAVSPISTSTSPFVVCRRRPWAESRVDLRVGERREQTFTARAYGHVSLFLLSARVATRAARRGAGWPDS